MPLEERKNVLQSHQLWLTSGGKEGEKANFEGAELYCADLQDAILDEAEFRKANLTEANLQRAVLRGASFEGARLCRANLQNGFFERADFKSAVLIDANLQDSLFEEASFEGAELEGAEIQNASFYKANFKNADLRRISFQGAYLRETNFESAHAPRGDLRNAILNGTEFKNADLTEANLQGAELRRASFDGAILRGANLREADLQNAKLENAEFLLTAQLAGANVAGAKLPSAIAEFNGLETIAEATSNAQKLFIAMLGGCLYSWLTIGTTKDTALLTNSASSPLPIIGTELPIVGFYTVAPIVLLAMYFYFHLNMQRLWETLADLPAVFPDGRSLDKRADPWLLNGLVSAHFLRLRRHRPALSRVQQWLSILLAWWVVPVTLFAFWGRFLPRHDWSATTLHAGLLTAAVGFGWMSYRLARATLRGIARTPFLWKQAWSDRRTYKRIAATFVTFTTGVTLYFISLGGIEGSKDYQKGYRMLASIPERSIVVLPFINVSDKKENAFFADGVQDEILTRLARIPDLKVVSRTSIMSYRDRSIDLRGMRDIARELEVSYVLEGRVERSQNQVRVTAHLFDARIGRRVWSEAHFRSVEDAWNIQVEIAHMIAAEAQRHIPTQKKPTREERRTAEAMGLRVIVPRALSIIGFSPFANLAQVDVSAKPDNWTGNTADYSLVKGTRLAGAQMQYANARAAFLMNADLFHANLFGANLEGANLDHAKLSRGNLCNVFGPDVKLTYADLESADLSNAHLENGNLLQANLSNANLADADLFHANLSNVTATNAKFERVQLSNANMQNARLSNSDLSGASLEYANLSNAELLGTNFSKAVLFRANFSKADLSGANLSNAFAPEADFTMAILDGTNLQHADLTGVKGITKSQLQKAKTDEGTRLPENIPP